MKIIREKMKNMDTRNRNLIRTDLYSRERNPLDREEKDNNSSGFQEMS